MTPTPLRTASHASTLFRLGNTLFVMAEISAPGAAVAPATTPDTHPSPPITPYCTRRIELKTSKVVNCTFDCWNTMRTLRAPRSQHRPRRRRP